jgi:hypothetical protein
MRTQTNGRQGEESSMIDGTLARVVRHHHRRRAHRGASLRPCTVPAPRNPAGRAAPSAGSNRATRPVAFVLLALTTGWSETRALSASRAQAIEIDEVDSAPCPCSCLGRDENAMWTLVHRLNILGASPRELVTCALLHLATPAPRHRAEQVRESRGSPAFFLPFPGVWDVLERRFRSNQVR